MVLISKEKAAAEMLRIVRKMRMVPLNDRNTARMTDEGRYLTAALTIPLVSTAFPATLANGRLNLPTLIVRFFDFHVFPGTQIPLNEDDQWTRLVITATTTNDLAYSTTYPHNVVVSGLALDSVAGSLPVESNEPGKGYGDTCRYYIYLVRTSAGTIIDTYPQTLVQFGQTISADPPG